MIRNTSATLGWCLVLALFLSPFAVRGDFLDDDLYYEFEYGSETHVRISGLRDSSATHINIPSTVVYAYYDYDDRDNQGNARLKYRTCTVTSIGGSAFSDCTGLTSVTIPSSVMNIEKYAFEFCSGLTSITIPDGVTSIGDFAFKGNRLVAFEVSVDNLSYKAVSGFLLTKDGKTLVAVPGGLKSVTIPDSVVSIGESAFSGCSGLESVTIPNGVTNIGASAFSGCSGLTSMTIPDSVTNIGYAAFGGCSGLTSVTIPDSVTRIGREAFFRCSGLTGVIFAGDAPSVDNYTFYRVGSSCTAYVKKGSTGWGVEIPGTWNGINIQYLTPEVALAVANEAGSGTVELDGELPNGIEVASGVTVVAKGENLNAGALSAKITPLPHEAGQSASLFKVTATTALDGSVSLSVVLDEREVKPDETAGEIVGGKNMAALGAAADGGNVSVSLPSAKLGLYYGIAAAGELSRLDEAASHASLVQAGADGVIVPVTKPTGGAAFFKVIVSDRAR